MKVYSDVLNAGNLYDAARVAGVSLFHIRELPRTRVRARGWEISLSGSSPYSSQTSFCETHRAATWKEHGVWMAELYKLDPNARIGWYKTIREFVDQTRILSAHPGNNIGKRAEHYQAPWLKDRDLMAVVS